VDFGNPALLKLYVNFIKFLFSVCLRVRPERHLGSEGHI
jgi:hypothetical protein